MRSKVLLVLAVFLGLGSPTKHDRKSGNWWLSLGSNHLLVGYWPSEIFANLTYTDEVHWGGEVVDSPRFGRQTMICMGSGHFPVEGFGKASYSRSLGIIDKNNILQPAQDVELKATTPEFYNIKNLSRDGGNGKPTI
ncbi:unnamed protein product [Eruca vesicaria subsp. sativa]|uniref:Neprosin PEP catalytic domain-containing protein n=1 Tax=Eruca vesicaria subsp. sativa TaxID=29727 RepID=A0ABC8LQM0_ERUVS|nr:unnamed protein product [Eruca vesicaria subsp. sativa]